MSCTNTNSLSDKLTFVLRPKRPAAVLSRTTFTTSRLIEFCSRKELVAQTGHDEKDWPCVIAKELIDNALDIAEEAEVAPVIDVSVSTERGEIIVTDNGPGIPPETVANILDYSTRTSSREAYASPTRGAQGNALKTIVAMPYALDGTRGQISIEARGTAHRITFRVDQVRQEPKIDHETAGSFVKTGTRVTVNWPVSASSILQEAKSHFLQVVSSFAWLNPHLTITVDWDGGRGIDRASNPEWRKWRACDPTSAHWYDQPRFERYIGAHVKRDQDLGRDRTVRDFIAEIRGLTASAKQKLVLDEVRASRMSLAAFFGNDEAVNHDAVARLLVACKEHTRPVKPTELGLIGKEHILAHFRGDGVREETFKYQKIIGANDGIPYVVETAFGWCPNGSGERCIVTGLNWSAAIHNPFRSFGKCHDDSLDSILTGQHAGAREPIVFLLHYACPCIGYTDRGKSAIVVPGSLKW